MRPQDIATLAVAQADGCQLVALVTHGSQVNLRWAGSSLTTNGAMTGTQVSIVAMNPTGGTATTSGQVTTPEQVQALVRRARTAAAASQPDEERMDLPEAPAAPDWDLEPPSLEISDMAPLARGLGERMRADADLAHYGYAELDQTTTYLASTAGVRRRHTQRQGRAEFTAKTPDGSRSAWVGSADPDLAVDMGQVGAELREGLAHQAHHIDVPPGRHRVILSPSATADMMIEVYLTAEARSAMEGRSVFAGPDGPRFGADLGADVTLSSDPDDPAPGMACAPFEIATASSDSASTYDNGLGLSRTEWLRGGQLMNLISSRSTAAQLGRPAAPGIDNLRMNVGVGSGSPADLVARTESGLLITCLWYNRIVDPQTLLLTGLTRDGVYVVRDGRIVGSCGNFRFNESPVAMLGRIVDASDEERTLAREMGDYFNRAMMPALVVDDFNLSTASEAH